MTQYIDKSAVVAEIERRKHKLLDHIILERDKEWVVRTAHQLNRIIMFINTLEAKEVDLNESARYYLLHQHTSNKEILIREYFALKYKFAKLHNSEILFNEIKIYSEEFTEEELNNRIASIKTQLELK